MVLAYLIDKIRAVTLTKGDVLARPNEKLNSIYVMYSG